MDNMFGCMVDIKGNVGNILLLLNNPCKQKDMVDGIMNTDSSSILITTFKKGLLTFELEKDSIFCISLEKKIFLYGNTAKVITSPEGAYISETVLVFPGMDKFEEAKQFILDVHGLEVIDLVGVVHAYQSLDLMIERFNKKKLKDESLIMT